MIIPEETLFAEWDFGVWIQNDCVVAAMAQGIAKKRLWRNHSIT